MSRDLGSSTRDRRTVEVDRLQPLPFGTVSYKRPLAAELLLRSSASCASGRPEQRSSGPASTGR